MDHKKWYGMGDQKFPVGTISFEKSGLGGGGGGVGPGEKNGFQDQNYRDQIPVTLFGKKLVKY